MLKITTRFTINSEMKFKLPVLAAAFICCVSCLSVDNELGLSLVPDSGKYTIVSGLSVPLDVEMAYSDSLSGYSQYYMSIGSLFDKEMGSVRRSCVMDLVPMTDTLDFGKDPEVLRFHFTAPLDTIQVAEPGQEHILQNLNVYQMSEAISPKSDYTTTADVESRVDRSRRIAYGAPVLNGTDSLSFDFTREYASQYLSLTPGDLSSLSNYKKKIKGIYLEVPPAVSGGRINRYSLQLAYDIDTYVVSGSYAELRIRSTYSGARRDTSFLFYFSPAEIYDVDSLLVNSSSGALPQHCLNLVSHDKGRTDEFRGRNQKELHVEGGAGLKPKVSAAWLKKAVEDRIREEGHDPSSVLICKASLVFPFEVKDKDYDRIATAYPKQLSPNVKYSRKFEIEKETVYHAVHADLTDYSSESENKGDINRTTMPMQYAPDVTYHLQEILDLAPGSTAKDLEKYDVWLLAKAEQVITTVTAGSDEMSDYYSMLAYQSYYGSMYGGGYGGYGGYGDYYSNYYSYMLAAMYAGNSSTSTSSSMVIDADGYYNAVLYGPAWSDDIKLVPRLEFSYAIPNNRL